MHRNFERTGWSEKDCVYDGGHPGKCAENRGRPCGDSVPGLQGRCASGLCERNKNRYRPAQIQCALFRTGRRCVVLYPAVRNGAEDQVLYWSQGN